MNFGGQDWYLYTVGYIYQSNEPLSATHLEFYRDGLLKYTLDRGDVIISAGVVYEDMLSGALSGYYKKAETYSAAQIDTKKADKVKREEIVEYGEWDWTQGEEFGGTLTHTHGNGWTDGVMTLYWYGGKWALTSTTGLYIETAGLSSAVSLTFDDNVLAYPIAMTRRGYSYTVLSANVVYEDMLSAYATNDRLESLSGSVIRRDANTITTGGVVTDYLASNLVGGIRVRFSAHNLDNYTAYAYGGVAVRRNR